ncbi:MAG: alpha/beta hydrolase [Ponticaulis sp.]|nr:alpha/beta hydrolase [Ponticaulis sp.]|tara:strand:- start:9294 stop:10109 length:816 start_codon:yes stop_codon:yes gene_type:complete
MLPLTESFQFNRDRIAWGKWGAGPPLVLVHGFPWSSQSWRKLISGLACNFTVYAFDMPGTGLSEKHDDQIVDESRQSQLLHDLIRFWKLDRPHMIGHDFGGLAALRAHFLHGVDYATLHLIDSVALLPSGSPFYQHVAQHEEAFAGLPNYAHAALFKAYIQNAAFQPLSTDVSDIYLSAYCGPDGQPSFYRQIAHANTNNIAEASERYAPCDFPIHIIWGEHDSFIPLERGRKLRDLLKADSFTVIPDAAHLVQEDAPEALLGAILTTLLR